MALGDRGREATLGNALSLSARFALSQMEAEQVIDEMKGYAGRWEAAALTRSHQETLRQSGPALWRDTRKIEGVSFQSAKAYPKVPILIS